MKLSPVKEHRLPLQYSIAQYALTHKDTELDCSLAALRRLDVAVPSFGLEEDLEGFLYRYRATLHNGNVRPFAIQTLPPKNCLKDCRELQECISTISYSRRLITQVVLQNFLIHQKDTADLTYALLDDFEVEEPQRFSCNTLHTALQEVINIRRH